MLNRIAETIKVKHSPPASVLLLIFGLLFVGFAATACIQPIEDTGTAAMPAAPVTAIPSDAGYGNAAAAEALVEQMASGHFEDAVASFDETMTKALPSTALASTWQQIEAQAGAFVSVLGTRTGKEQGYDVVYVSAEFEQTPLDIKVVFDDAGSVAGLFFQPVQSGDAGGQSNATPPYADPEQFTEQPVTVGEGTDWPLPGTLTLPAGDGPFPAVILVHGSGPNDRNETIGPNQPFRDIAWGLAAHGIATLRYDKRTLVYGEAMADDPTLTVQEEVIDDVLAAIKLLQQTDAVDPQQIFVLGHSLGGTLIPRIGAQTDDVAGLIVMAGADRPIDELMLEQMRYIFGLDGEISDAEQAQLDDISKVVDRIESADFSPDTPASELLGAPGSYWLDLRDYVPSQTAATLTQPMLILQGERDYQVTMVDFERWRAALEGRSNVTFKSYPDLNHLFIAGEGPITPAEYQKPGFVAEEVIRDIADWIRQL